MAEFLRPAWGAKPSKAEEPPLHNEPNGVVHDIGGGDPYPSSVVATLQQIQSSEQHGEYVDIAYNWGVDKDGNLWELRGDVSDGATKGYAGISFSVLAICNASAPNFVPTAALVAGIAACFRNAQSRGVLAKNAHIDSHHWFDAHVTSSPTQCCGVPLIAEIPTIRNLVYQVVPRPKPVRGLEEEPMLYHATDSTPNKFRGVRVDCNTKTIAAHGGAVIQPAPVVNNPNAWMGSYEIPGGFVIVTADEDEYKFQVN